MIEDAYRRVKFWRLLRQRVVLKRLAYDCRAVFETRNRVVWAATVLQRAWKRYIEGRRKEDEGRDRRIYPRVVDEAGRRREDRAKKPARSVHSALRESYVDVDIWLP